MICNKCGRENSENAKFCAGCGTPLQEAAAQAAPTATPGEPPAAPYHIYTDPAGVLPADQSRFYTGAAAAAPANALPKKRRDIPQSTFILMILNAVFAFLSVLMLYIPTYWTRKIEYVGSTGTKGRKYYSDFSDILRCLKDNELKKYRDFHTLLLTMVIIITVIAVVGIIFAILRFRFSAGFLIAPALFTLACVYERTIGYFHRLFYYINHSDKAKYRTRGILFLTPLACAFAIITIVLSLMVYATYRKKKSEAAKPAVSTEETADTTF